MPKTNTTAVCQVDDCESAARFRGWCSKHYYRWVRHGDPTKILVRPPSKIRTTPDGLRYCIVCGEAKPASAYHKDSKKLDGLRNTCKACVLAREKARHAANPEVRRTKEKIRRTIEGDQIRERDRMRYERDRDKRLALVAAGQHKRRARLAAVAFEDGITVVALRKRDGDNCTYCKQPMLFKAQAREHGINPMRASIEHIVPLSRGGEHTFANTALACHRCNTSKNAKTVDEWEALKALARDPNTV